MRIKKKGESERVFFLPRKMDLPSSRAIEDDIVASIAEVQNRVKTVRHVVFFMRVM